MSELNDYFKYKCAKGLQFRGLSDQSIYQDRLELELKTIIGMGFSGYFLIVQDFITWAKNQGIYVGPGRGSAAGSLASYCLQITDLDPIRWDLLFERFMNPSRISMPDIDIDIEKRYRDRVIQYVVDKYGSNCVAHIGTFGKQRAKGAIKSVTKTLGHPYAIGDMLTKLLMGPIAGRPQPLKTSIERIEELNAYRNSNRTEGDILRWAEKIENSISNIGVHASGVVISNEPLMDTVPLFLDKDGEVVTQWEMNNIEEVGLIKFDFLGLDALSKIHLCVDLVKELRGIEIDINNLDLEDEKTFANLRKGDNVGIFQLEASGGMRDLLVQIRPTGLEDLIALVAIYRPGPLGSDYKNIYLDVRAGNRLPEYLVPELEQSLSKTSGWLIYQEQCMEIAKRLCGYTGAEADDLRKAIGKKIPEKMAKHESKFKKGWVKNNLPADKGNELWDDMVSFAAYGFNRTVDKDTKVATIDGIKRIEDCSSNDTVFTVQNGGQIVPSKVIALHDHGTVPLWEVEFDDGTIERCTLDHKWLTEWGQQPLYRILDLDCEVWGSSTYKETIEWTPKKLREMQESCEEWYQQHNGKDLPVWYKNKDAASRGQETQTELQKLQDQEKVDTSADKNKEQQNSTSTTDSIRDSKENISKTRNMRSESSSSSPVETRKPREALRDMEEGLCQSEEIKNGDVSRTSPCKAWIHTEYQNPMWNRTKTGGFYQQRTPGNPRGGWTVALLSGSWRRSITENPDQGPDARDRDIAKKVETSKNLYGELQILRRTYENKLREPLRYINRPKPPAYSMYRKVVRVSYIGMRQGYDLEIDHPDHNFLLASGLCCSNSHAAAYAFITYQTAYLKSHYPEEFMCAVMTADTGEQDQMIKHLTECKRLGIAVLPPDINLSREAFFVDQGSIRFGLGPIKNIGASTKTLLEERHHRSFTSLRDFCERVDLGIVNRKKLESLIKAGAFDQMDMNRATMLSAVEDIWEYREQVKRYTKKMVTFTKKLDECVQRIEDIKAGKLSKGGKKLKTLKEPPRPEEPEWPTILEQDEMPESELQTAEHELLGFYVSSHPMDSVGKLLGPNFSTIDDLKGMPSKTKVSTAAVITGRSIITTKKKQQMCFFNLEDMTGSIDAVCFSGIYTKYKDTINENVPLRIDGTVETTEGDDGSITKLIAWKLTPLGLEKDRSETIEAVVKASQAKEFIQLMEKYRGNLHRVNVIFETEDGTRFKASSQKKIGNFKGAFIRELIRINNGAKS